MNKKPNILITSAGAKIPLIKAFQSAGAKVFASDTAPHFAAQHFADDVVELPTTTDSSYLPHLLRQCKTHNIQMVIPTRDGELPFFAENYDILQKNGIMAMVGNSTTIEICNDKQKFRQFCHESGFKTPKTANSDGPYPQFFRPNLPIKHIGPMGIVNQAMGDIYRALCPNGLFEEYITAPEYSIDGLCDMNGHFIQAIARERVAVARGEVVVSTTRNLPHLTDIARQFCQKTCIRGAFNIQLFLHNDEILLIECNPRFGGGSAFSIACGLNTPHQYLSMLRGQPTPPQPLQFNKTLYRYGCDLVK